MKDTMKRYFPSFDEPVGMCDLCDSTELEDVLNGTKNELRKMYKDETDDLIICEYCLQEKEA